MSKTLGNVIDPIDTMQEFGTDALRFTLALGTAGQVCHCLKKIMDMGHYPLKEKITSLLFSTLLVTGP